MNLETKITIYKFTPQLFTLTRFFPVGVGTFPTELSGKLRHVFSPAGAGPETLTGYLCLGIGTGNRTGRSEGLP
ncbi:hypothetical protein [Phocaeicola vulgatus]|uniref:hypothetical protein n=1 Tax=Phocaeicola vulgatus TaxID=821 RepID=UPI00189CEF33|nr:hypothetical protein [Phocaeicola vulgatus]